MCIYEEDEDQDEYEYRVGPSAEEKRTVYRINYESVDLISCFYCCLTPQISRTAQKKIHALSKRNCLNLLVYLYCSEFDLQKLFIYVKLFCRCACSDGKFISRLLDEDVYEISVTGISCLYMNRNFKFVMWQILFFQ